jgi:heme-degrading monooxygenase HmoA
MYARILEAKVLPENLDRFATISKQQLAKNLPGFKGFYLLANKNNGKLLTITLWETLEAAEANGAQVRQEIERNPEEVRELTEILEPLGVENYEVVMQSSESIKGLSESSEQIT